MSRRGEVLDIATMTFSPGPRLCGRSMMHTSTALWHTRLHACNHALGHGMQGMAVQHSARPRRTLLYDISVGVLHAYYIIIIIIVIII